MAKKERYKSQHCSCQSFKYIYCIFYLSVSKLVELLLSLLYLCLCDLKTIDVQKFFLKNVDVWKHR